MSEGLLYTYSRLLISMHKARLEHWNPAARTTEICNLINYTRQWAHVGLIIMKQYETVVFKHISRNMSWDPWVGHPWFIDGWVVSTGGCPAPLWPSLLSLRRSQNYDGGNGFRAVKTGQSRNSYKTLSLFVQCMQCQAPIPTMSWHLHCRWGFLRWHVQARSTVDVAWISFGFSFFLACHYLPFSSFSNSPVEPCILGSRSNSFRRWRLRMRRWRPEWHHRSPNEWASKTTPTKVMPSAQLRTPLVNLYRLYIFIHNITMTYHRYVYIYIYTIYFFWLLVWRSIRCDLQ